MALIGPNWASKPNLTSRKQAYPIRQASIKNKCKNGYSILIPSKSLHLQKYLYKNKVLTSRTS